MGKEEIYIFFSVYFQWGYIKKNTEIFIEQSSAFHMTCVQIADFYWLPR